MSAYGSPSPGAVQAKGPIALAPANGGVYAGWHPFLRDQYADYDPAAGAETLRDSWRPGWRYEPDGPEDSRPAWDGEGAQLRRVVSIHKPGPTYPTRVFYVRQWRDPDGKVFGKTGLRIATQAVFMGWARGERMLDIIFPSRWERLRQSAEQFAALLSDDALGRQGKAADAATRALASEGIDQ